MKLLLLLALLLPMQTRPNATGVVVGHNVLPFTIAYYSKDNHGYTVPVYSTSGYELLVKIASGDTVKVPVSLEYYQVKEGTRIKFFTPAIKSPTPFRNAYN
jgi:hypothetical protein